MLPAESSVPTILQTKTRFLSRQRDLIDLESRLKQVGAISGNLPRFEVLQNPSADDCRRREPAGGGGGSAGPHQLPLYREALRGRGLQPLPLVVVWGCGRFLGSLGFPNVQLTFSLSVCPLLLDQQLFD